jgi:hypothetical protein
LPWREIQERYCRIVMQNGPPLISELNEARYV